MDARVRRAVYAALCSVALVACGLDFDKFAPDGAAPSGEAGGGGGDGPAAEAAPADATAKDAAAEGGGADATSAEGGGSTDAAGADVAQETGPTGCTVSNSSLGVGLAPGPITIDGDLADWGNPPVTVLAVSSAALIVGPNGTCTAANAQQQCMVPNGDTAEAVLLRDATNLYVGFRVTQPNLGGNNAAMPYLDDAVEIYLRGDAVATGDYTSSDHQYVVDWNNHVLDYGPPGSGNGQPNPPGFSSAVKVTPGNKAYTVEARIALSQVGQAAFAAGDSLGFDFGVDHGMGNTQSRSLLVWWMASHGTLGCTTAKCTGCSPDQPYCDTALFGTACAQ